MVTSIRPSHARQALRDARDAVRRMRDETDYAPHIRTHFATSANAQANALAWEFEQVEARALAWAWAETL